MKDLNEKFNSIKQNNLLTLQERDNLQKDSIFYPSKIWTSANRFFSFLKFLPEEELRSIRIHTTAITGSPFLDFAYHPKRDSSDEVKLNTFWAASQYKSCTKSLPEEYLLSEPTPNDITRKICLPFRNKLITNDLVRYQRFVTNIYNLGIINSLKRNNRRTILEIGSGYGALAHHINKIFKEKTSYIMVDLPELLFWASIYLAVNNPDAKLFIYDPKINKKKLSIEEIESFNFIFIPNYKLNDLIGNIDIDLAINLLSFQEMTEEQIRFYCNYISKNLKGYFGSDNMNIHPVNNELTINTDSILRSYFKIFPSEIDFKKLCKKLNAELWQVYSFFGVSKDSDISFDVINPVIQGVNYEFNFKRVDFFDSVIIEQQKTNNSTKEESAQEEQTEDQHPKSRAKIIIRNIERFISKLSSA